MLYVICLLIVGFNLPVFAETLQVPGQYTTIQMAINDANEGDTIIVSPGTYLENITFRGKNIVLTGTNPDDPEVVAATVIHGYGQSTVVTFANGETSEAVITGFTITGGYGTMLPAEFIGRESVITGGGILCMASSPTITKNVITGNNNEDVLDTLGIEAWGAGIACLGSNAIITHNIIRNNSSVIGGGILAGLENANITNNLIYDNSAMVGGGVLLLAGTLTNNTIVSNSASDSGGNVYFASYTEYGPCIALSNIIGNAQGAESIYREGSIPEDRIEYNSIWDGIDNIYKPETKTKDARNNIYQDPMLADLRANDFRLQMDSPCINAGDPNCEIQPGQKDMYGNDRLIYGRVDIGAAEFSGNLRPVAVAGDDQTLDEIPDYITLDAGHSYDPDGNQDLNYTWTQTAGSSVDIDSANSQVATFKPSDYGVYSFSLSVSDGKLDSESDDVTILIGASRIPVAVTGLPVYASDEVVKLDGTASYDPDNSGELLYAWEQVSGPILTITDSDTATPTIGGFIQTDLLQICEFQLVVYDGQYQSLPEIAEVRIFPYFERITYSLESETFDPNKPTFIYFGGGDCINGSGSWSDSQWNEVANILNTSYTPDPTEAGQTYYRYGDMLVQYLYEAAPNYNQMIQTSGHSTGGQPCIDAAIRMNLTYKDPRFNVNRVTFLDGRCRDYSESILNLLESDVDGEQCWMDTYEGTGPYFYPGILNVQVALNNHGYPPSWYKSSLTSPSMNDFNGGIIGGAFWSVFGPGKNLQLAKTPLQEIYRFHWEGGTDGEMQFFDEANFPARLPEPVTLVGPVDAGDPDGAVLTSEVSENAVGYQLLFGSDPQRVQDYTVVSDTPEPPAEVITSLPFEQTWWTVKARDAYGSTIFADPKLVTELNLTLPVTNMNTGVKYGYIQDAIDEAAVGDEIVLGEGTYHEDIVISSKNLMLRSVNPDDPDVTAATVIQGSGDNPLVSFSGRVDSRCILAGLTITGGKSGLYGSDGVSPAIKNCVIKGNRGAGIKLWKVSNVTATNCIIAENTGAGIELYQLPARTPNSATLINCTVAGNLRQGVWGGSTTISNSIVYFNGVDTENVQMDVISAAATYSDVQGTWPGSGNIDVDPLFADYVNGDYHLMSQAGRWYPADGAWVQDDVSSLCIDAGDPAGDVGMEPSPNGSVINMGAYGGTAQASKSH